MLTWYHSSMLTWYRLFSEKGGISLFISRLMPEQTFTRVESNFGFSYKSTAMHNTMDKHKTVVCPMLTHWRYCNIALIHWTTLSHAHLLHNCLIWEELICMSIRIYLMMKIFIHSNCHYSIVWYYTDTYCSPSPTFVLIMVIIKVLMVVWGLNNFTANVANFIEIYSQRSNSKYITTDSGNGLA